MLKMDQYAHIREAHFRYGESIKAIARRTGHSKNTIRKMLRGEYNGYRPRRQQPYPAIGPYMEIIDQWLTADREKPRKQRHTARRVFDRLVAEHGYLGCETTVRKYVREAKERLGIARIRAFIPLEPELGKEAEVDWGTAVVVVAGELERVKFFCMRSKASGKPFIRLYPCERQQAFFDALMRAFVFFGGVFSRLIFDNLTTAVRKVLQGKARIEQEAFGHFRAYYHFEARFCNPGAGHEKGGVEGLVGFARRNFLVPVPEGASLEELNARLLAQCIAYDHHRISGKDAPVGTLFEKERAQLLALPAAPFTNEEVRTAKVDKYATVTADRNRYSVPTRYTGFTVRVVLGVDSIVIVYRDKRIAQHVRLFGNNKWQLDADHYLELLRQRPLAFDSARAIRQWKQQWSPQMHRLLAHFQQEHGPTRGIKSFIDVLMLYREFPAKNVETAMREALSAGITASEGVRQLLVARHTATEHPPLAHYDRLPDADISVYHSLGGVR